MTCHWPVRQPRDLTPLPPSYARRVVTCRAGRFEVSVPDWFNQVYEGKYKDVEAFLEGTIAFVRSQPT